MTTITGAQRAALAQLLAVADHLVEHIGPPRDDAADWMPGAIALLRPLATIDNDHAPPPAPGDLRAIQRATAEYAAAAWPGLTIEVEALALAEEVGELARAVVKRAHGNRGTAADWTAELRREAGDVGLVLANIAAIEGFDLYDVLIERLEVILARDVDHDPVTPASSSIDHVDAVETITLNLPALPPRRDRGPADSVLTLKADAGHLWPGAVQEFAADPTLGPRRLVVPDELAARSPEALGVVLAGVAKTYSVTETRDDRAETTAYDLVPTDRRPG